MVEAASALRRVDNVERTPNVVDVHVGTRIRVRRKALGVSQAKLADDLGLTFQQVQKYERGVNRVSSSKLYEIAASLQVPVQYFFEGLADPAERGQSSKDVNSQISAHAFLMTSEGPQLAVLYPKLPASIRKKIMELVRVLANEEA